MRRLKQSSSSTYDESYAENECKDTDINQEPSKRRALNAHHLFAGGRQVHFDNTIEVWTIGNWKQALEEFEDENDCEKSSDDSDGSETNDERTAQRHELSASRSRNSSNFQV